MDYGGGGGVHGEETADTAGQSSQTLKERQQEALAQQVGPVENGKVFK